MSEHLHEDLENDEESLKITQRNQLESPLLRIPPEIRQLIYEYALSSEIWNANRRYKGKVTTARLHHKFKEGLALLLSCKQIYHEAKNVPVMLSTFAFNSIKTFISWAGHPLARFIRFVEIRLRIYDHMNSFRIDGWKSKFERVPVCSRRRFPALERVKFIIEKEFCQCHMTINLEQFGEIVKAGGEYVEAMVKDKEDHKVALSVIHSIKACSSFVDSQVEAPCWEWDGHTASWASGIEQLKLEKQEQIRLYPRVTG